MTPLVRRLHQKVNWLLSRHPGRAVCIRSDDTFLVSYPKSGNTWLRFLVGNLTHQGEPVDFLNLESRVPDIYANSERYLHGLPGPRILKSHEPFDSRYPRVIYLTRDPRDVVLSYFHHQRKFSQIGNGYPFERFLDRFLAGTLDSYGSWRDNVFGWVARRHLEVGPIVHVVRYEDLIDTPVDALAGIAQFLSVDSSPERLDQTLGLSSVERMRALELSQRHSAPHIGGRHELSFLPQATKGGWRHLLPEGAAERIWSRWQGSMEFLGYR